MLQTSTISNWIRERFPTKGADWLFANKVQCERFLGVEISSESYSRLVRKIRQEVKTPNPNQGEYVSSIADAVEFHDVDASGMEIVGATVNTWGKDNSNKQVKLRLERRKEPEIDIPGMVEEFKQAIQDYVPPCKMHTRELSTVDDKYMLEIALPDLHHQLLTWSKETGHDYDISISSKRILETVKHLVNFGSDYPLEKILLIFPGDLMNSDTIDGTTSKGTKQSDDSRWQKAFTTAWQAIRGAIDYCNEVADVDVIITSGNHDTTRAYFIGEVLTAWYANNSQVRIDNSPKHYKYYQYGKCMIGISHGDGAKADQLPLLMATDEPVMWANTIHREYHVGHLHHSATKGFQMDIEHPGCKVVQCSAISEHSDWTMRKGYRSIPEAQGFLWHREDGRKAQFHYRPKRD